MPQDRRRRPPARRAAVVAPSSGVQFRRALSLTVMTLVAPGLAQMVAGHRRIGRIALRIWAALLALVVVVAVVAFTSRSTFLSLVLDQRLNTLGRWILVVLAIGWVALLIDAWRLSAPLSLVRWQRLGITCVNGMLCVAIIATSVFAVRVLAAQNRLVDEVFSGDEVAEEAEGRYNVLLLGGDAGADRWGLRPDSINVASVDANTGRTVMVGLPRNLQGAVFPEGTPMHDEFPDGFDCDDCMLNGVYTWAMDHTELFEGVDDPGTYATRQAVEATTGLEISYTVMIDMAGFSQLVDAVGGVTINVKERTALAGINDAVERWLEPGQHKLNGDEALWYARTRKYDDDFARMGRQKCVMNAMLSQLSPQKVLMNVQDIADSGAAILTSDIPASELDRFADLALKARGLPIATVSLVPPAVDTADPDIDEVHRMIADAIAASEAADEAAKDEDESPSRPVSAFEMVAPAFPASPTDAEESSGDPEDDENSPEQSNASEDLASTC
ncbi:MAG: LCP family protein [Aeromicrobium sp.]|uniref:LCP family protein n=1 Tax=Aeromicrobium sp. TaxID=1871063 RepID=UPI0039E57CA5